MLTVCIQVLIQHYECINTAWGRWEAAEIAPYNNIPKLFQEVEYELIKQSASLCLTSLSVPRRNDQGRIFPSCLTTRENS